MKRSSASRKESGGGGGGCWALLVVPELDPVADLIVCVCVCKGLAGQRGVPFEQQVVIETKQGLIRKASGNSWSKQRSGGGGGEKQTGEPWNKVVII